MRIDRTTSALVAAVLLASTAAACSDDSQEAIEDDVRSAVTDAVDIADEASEDAVELAARNFASIQASQEFESAGYPIDGDLMCEANATSGLTAVEISCTGTTTDGGEASVSGTTSEFPAISFNELAGDFVGIVDGSEVFNVDRLG